MADLDKLIAELEASPFAGRLCKKAAKALRNARDREQTLAKTLADQAPIISHAKALCHCEADNTARVYYQLKAAVARHDRGLN